ncbi:MAG TPA: vitamin B12 dependent-methionine synthase activation domain-containing protein [Clostridia bacterium]|nr:vitamin B12 dependent-methionine synthase activation domain-containing protein [Clostridia bacterium]
MYIDKKEALRYMGYRGQKMDDSLQSLLDACIDEVKELSKESFTYQIFDMEKMEEGLHLTGTTLVLQGKAIRQHLSRAEKCAVMAVTLGIGVDKRISYYSRTDLTRGMMLDACATAAVEALCDMVQEEIKAKAGVMGLDITQRFSPGYGDFSIDIQKHIVRVLKAYEKIGLTVNECSIMIPRKSVTAVIGMQNEGCSVRSHKCADCEDKYCTFRKDRDENG